MNETNHPPKSFWRSGTAYAGAVIVLGALLILLSVSQDDWPGPADWLKQWTAWGAQYVALAVAGHSIYKLVDGFVFRLKGGAG